MRYVLPAVSLLAVDVFFGAVLTRLWRSGEITDALTASFVAWYGLFLCQLPFSLWGALAANARKNYVVSILFLAHSVAAAGLSAFSCLPPR